MPSECTLNVLVVVLKYSYPTSLWGLTPMFIAVIRKSFLQHFLSVVFVAFALRDYTLELYLSSLLAPKFSTVRIG
jgi:hypothetical protein